MTELLQGPAPSDDAVNAAADYHSQCSGRGSFALPATFNWPECLSAAYAVDFAPLLAENARLNGVLAEIKHLNSINLGSNMEMYALVKELKRQNAAMREALGAYDNLRLVIERAVLQDQPAFRDFVMAAIIGGRATLAGLDAPTVDESADIIAAVNATLDAPPSGPGYDRLMGAPAPWGKVGTPSLVIDYTNWRDERRMRKIIPANVFFGANEWHKEPQWILVARDCEDGERVKTFAFAGIHGFGEDSTLAQAERVIAEAVEIMRPVVKAFESVLRSADGAREEFGELDVAPEPNDAFCNHDYWALNITWGEMRAARRFVETHGDRK